MLITIDTEDRRPIYRQVADEIKALIARGELAEGATLPPVRQLAADLGLFTSARADRRSFVPLPVHHAGSSTPKPACSSNNAVLVRNS